MPVKPGLLKFLMGRGDCIETGLLLSLCLKKHRISLTCTHRSDFWNRRNTFINFDKSLYLISRLIFKKLKIQTLGAFVPFFVYCYQIFCHLRAIEFRTHCHKNMFILFNIFYADV